MGTTVRLGTVGIGHYYTDVCPYYVLPDGLAPVGRHYYLYRVEIQRKISKILLYIENLSVYRDIRERYVIRI